MRPDAKEVGDKVKKWLEQPGAVESLMATAREATAFAKELSDKMKPVEKHPHNCFCAKCNPAPHTCRTCAFWDTVMTENNPWGYGKCRSGFVENYIVLGCLGEAPSDGAEVEGSLLTGPDFGCVHHKERDSSTKQHV